MKNNDFTYTILGGVVYVALSASIIGIFLYTGWLGAILLSSLVGMALGYRGSKLENDKAKEEESRQFAEGFDWEKIEKSIQ